MQNEEGLLPKSKSATFGVVAARRRLLRRLAVKINDTRLRGAATPAARVLV